MQVHGKRIFVTVTCVILTWIVFTDVKSSKHPREKAKSKENANGNAELHFVAVESSRADTSPLHERWIVVTTIQQPTQQVKKLATLSGWKLVVVGDKKTPRDWSLPDAIYLSPQQQESLGYSVLKHLPYNSYSRKIVGYLYAIQHGAKVIYETDDDNAPDTDLSAFDDPAVFLVNTSALAYNPCVHFGQSSIWPRGFPLDMVGVDPPHVYHICRDTSAVLIKQGVVNGDPDVDAIFRLTRQHASTRLDVKFDPTAPPVVLPSGTFTPYNAQNTMLAYDAFWSLVLPGTVPFRMTDIWRSYWVQCLLWLVGGRLAYYPPIATQYRNAHEYIRDAAEETEMYTQTPGLLRFLSGWRCPHDDLPKCAMQLTIDMASQEFWGKDEVPLYHAWLQDLYNIGYVFPGLRPYSLSSFHKTVTCYPQEQNTSCNYRPELVKIDQKEQRPFCVDISI